MENSQLTPRQQTMVERLLVTYNRPSAHQRLDLKLNSEFKIKLTPKHDEQVYAQNLPTPTILKDEKLFELALQQEYGSIKTLPFSKYSSPIFAQRKPNGKLRILVDLRRINHLIKHGTTRRSTTIVTTITHAAQHTVGKIYFCKLDCSQAYHCLQMADQQSMQTLSFNF